MDAVLLAVLNALWQGAALIALVALALRAGLRRNATTACVVWSITFAVVALLPAIDLAIPRPPAKAPVHAAARAAQPLPAGRAVPIGRVDARSVAAPAPEPAPGLAERADELATRAGGVATGFVRTWGLGLVALWALIAGTLLVRLVRGYAAIASLKRGATPVGDPRLTARLRAAGHRRIAAVAASPGVEIPCAVGFRRPMILLPAHLAETLDADDLARIVLHESAHLQRYDDWTNALEQAICALQFFQPALYVARRGIDFEREVACDDRVLEDAGEPLRYAECLAHIVQRQVRGRQAAVVPGFVLRRPQVVARVRRIVDRSRDASPHLRAGAAILSGGVLVATLGIARLQVPVIAPAAAAAAAPLAAPAARVARPAVPAAHRAAAPARIVAAVVRAEDPTPAPSTVPSPQPSPSAPAPSPSASPYHRHVHAVAPRAAHVHAIGRSMDETPQPGLAPRAAVTVATSDDNAQTVTPAAAAPIAPAAPVAVIVAQSTPEAPRAAVVPVHRHSDLLDAIDEARYPHPSVDELIALHNQGVTGDYVRRMGALGRGRPSLKEIMSLATQGVSPDYVAVLDRRLAAHPSLDEIIALRTQGVSGAWLDGMATVGYAKLTPNEAISLVQQGISVTYVRSLLDAGLRSVTPAQLVTLRTQGVDGGFVRRLALHGYRNLTVDELVRLRASGVEP